MTETPHSREWYAHLARELGGYRHPWRRVLDGPDPELSFDALLMEHLSPTSRVLEAGCGHGPDAARFGSRCARWAAYDRSPELLALARQNAPHAEFAEWDGKSEVPLALRGPFDLIVSRRGPTGVIDHLPAVAAPGAHFLYVGPTLDVPQVPQRLGRIGWDILGEWRASVRAWAPTWEDWQLRCEFMGEVARSEDWDAGATSRGLPYREERSVVLAGPP
ncbi:class I SAM-dependent methyltransferase [Deinococcus koreensis]|uniref:SAM-dependent methyltransferase n=1 Tax=Deinococcus koreensis TaxID=2054903 RepID=A0A2K3UZ16_9DEIO|nr:class I SAM-dependent methyltransferase [Deinococcus koreensis]PNY81765.1 SAM-dependent methyltransferase [Deinococcus koreensis]